MKKLCWMLALLPALSFAHRVQLNQPLAPVSIAQDGELTVQNNTIAYRPWDLGALTGKVVVLQHIAGRSAAKEMNAPLMAKITEAAFPENAYQTVTVINRDDAIWGTSGFVKSSAEDSKLAFPWAGFVLDAEGVAQKTWALRAKASAIIVLDNRGKVLFVEEGALSETQQAAVLALIRANL